MPNQMKWIYDQFEGGLLLPSLLADPEDLRNPEARMSLIY
jgi:hypothetical protein